MSKYFFITGVMIVWWGSVCSQQLMVAGRPSQLDIRKAGGKSLRITLKPVSFLASFPSTPAVVERKYDAPEISLKEKRPLTKDAGNFKIQIEQNPLTISVANRQGRLIQKFVFPDEGNVIFQTN